jgi:aspartyl-tRNA(Asn)/glutamyl-tRNA(Gln) amidotransferase subunit C
MKTSEILHIAKLAKIALSEEDVAHYCDLSTIFDLIQPILDTDTSNVEPLSHPMDLSSRLRQDKATTVQTPSREKLLALAPEAEANVYLVPEVFE